MRMRTKQTTINVLTGKMKTKYIADGYVNGNVDDEESIGASLHYAKGQFFIKYVDSTLRKISAREAIKTFIQFIGSGEASTNDLAPLIEAVSILGRGAIIEHAVAVGKVQVPLEVCARCVRGRN